VELLAEHNEDPVHSGVTIIDVRDEDFKGGNIPHCLNIPAHEFLKHVDKLVDQLSNQHTIIFHCYKSQVRGPTCAKQFIQALAKRYNKQIDNSTLQQVYCPNTTIHAATLQTRRGISDGLVNRQSSGDDTAISVKTENIPSVYVLRDGFEGYIRYIMTNKNVKNPNQHIHNYLQDYWGYKI